MYVCMDLFVCTYVCWYIRKCVNADYAGPLQYANSFVYMKTNVCMYLFMYTVCVRICVYVSLLVAPARNTNSAMTFSESTRENFRSNLKKMIKTNFDYSKENGADRNS